jgi:hypothetical protein
MDNNPTLKAVYIRKEHLDEYIAAGWIKLETYSTVFGGPYLLIEWPVERGDPVFPAEARDADA